VKRIIAGVVTILALVGVGAALFLPPTISQETIDASVVRKTELLDEAWKLPGAATYNRTLTFQSNGSRCGPASIANIFRSLGDAVVTENAVLAGTGRCWTGICILGLTLDELAEVARRNTKRKVTVLRNLTSDAFREHLRLSNDPARRYIINFTREKIFGAGVGHHSPIGGYLEAADLVLVLDVNQQFGPWLVSRTKLFEAMDTLDGDKKRGLLLIQ
jgi:hypothetical protein